jgi:CheY-like chemotaxis protein
MPISIMIIDDDEDDLFLFSSAVEDFYPGIHCIKAEAVDNALLILRNEAVKPDFIFLDLNMPRVNGKSCLKILKQSKEFRDIPVIIYTTSKLQKDMVECKRLGAAAFITKPSNLKSLYNYLELVLNREWEKIEHTVTLSI